MSAAVSAPRPPLTMVGDADAMACEGDSCVVPGPSSSGDPAAGGAESQAAS
ncbi:hypothetical protein [Homoserinibacter sp. YIM 151385]|uniref:hypothetical protein n=1 Tax=Homoserinibacter sp. YIM 151385 TaxID=2985506 RepID=UPI0022EFFC04|nr:hypothetical protein [Homoserinibacter sp. YIM 151385]WBU38426.1 hypothetical protein OF852_02235 [Homoserinibacter sp. YIM 151385]